MRLKKYFPFLIAAGLLAPLFCGGAYGQKVKIYKEKPAKQNKKDAKKEDTTASAEPDKVLYDRAINEVKRSHYTEARLDFQTLINTYPDSEYLAKAKLGVADSYYKEGGTSNLTLAVGEYKNFIVFFPFLDEAGYAQMQVAMSHYRMIEKSDRDNSQAISAEQEFQTFLLKYPQSTLVPKAEQDLRNVQEVLADGEYRTARFYYLKPYYPAAAARLFELSERYPLYSQSDEVLWMLGDIYMRAKKASKSEDDKNHWGDLAASCYGRIVRNYPLSPRAIAAKAALTGMGMPVPQADPEAIERMKQDQLYVKQHRPHMYAKPIGMVRSEPDVLAADRYGKPNLEPPDDIVSAKDVLSQGAPGPVFDKPKDETEADANGAQPSGGDISPVEAAPADSGAAGMTAGAQIIAAPASAADAQPAGAAPSAAPDAVPAAAPAPQPAATSNPGASTLTVLPDSSSNSGGATVSSTAPAPSAAMPAPAAANATPTATSQSGTSTRAGTTESSDTAKAEKADPKTESSSKKKKGLKKIIP